MHELPARIKRLNLAIAGADAGTLAREDQYVFTYASDRPHQPEVSLLMPPSQTVWTDGDLFPVMDMNLPEGYLFQRIIEVFPKRALTKMHLLALMGDNGIGRLGYAIDGNPLRPRVLVSREELLASPAGSKAFAELADAYLATSAGISGVQPKIMAPSRASIPIPDLIVKSAGPQYPGLAANEYICLLAASRAGIETPRFDLSAGGDILVIDRFDIDEHGRRLGFEDIAALMALRVHDRFSARKYHGSYESVAEVVRLLSSRPAEDLRRFFAQLVLCVCVRNGDAHLKNFGMLYTGLGDARLAPIFDVVTTTIYKYERPGGFEDVDRTMALKWRRGRKHASRAYPTTEELLAFGREVCDVPHPQEVVLRIAQAMGEALREAEADPRVPPGLSQQMGEQWQAGFAYARECRQTAREEPAPRQ